MLQMLRKRFQIQRIIRSLLLVFLMFGGLSSPAESFLDNTRGWVSLSSLWGQGGMGLSYRNTNYTYSISDFYNYSWKDSSISYNEVELLRRHGSVFEGVRLRYQYEDHEVAPFTGRHDYFDKDDGTPIPFSLHNEIEWRESPYTGDSYLRTQHGFTLFSPKKFFDKNEFTPFASIVAFYDWEEMDIEKTRVYVGYSLKVDRYKFSLYYIPWRDGSIEEEWDDQRSFGATIKYLF